MDLTRLIEGLHPLERKVLPLLAKTNDFNELVRLSGLQEVEVMRALQWLQNKGVLAIRQSEAEVAELDENGLAYRTKGLPEQRFLAAIADGPRSLEEIKTQAGLSSEEISVCIGVLKKRTAIALAEGKVSITPGGKQSLQTTTPEEEFISRKFPINVSTLDSASKGVLDTLLKRKRIVKLGITKTRSVQLTELGMQAALARPEGKIVDKISPEIIRSGQWRDAKFRRYDVGINVPRVYPGKRHFVNLAIEYAKRIWLEMGFTEMRGSMVQQGFWNFDALFTAQDHPVREMQDTYYIQSGKGRLPSHELVERVRKTHEDGWTTASKGWQYRWSAEDAQRTILRTHTTCLSARTLAALRKNEWPVKFFSVGKCFRNETLDFSHLFEFNQTEGIVVDPDANFRHLLGYLRTFANKMGYSQVRFRPAYFPYTEPSVEGDVYDPVRKKWVEVIAAGVFRPEVVKPLLGEDVPVLAWGPGFDRMITGAYNLGDIRDLYKNDIKQLREIPLWMR